MTYSPTYDQRYQPSDAQRSNASYQPSILELARKGNFRAIAYWINSILAPQGIHVQTQMGRTGRLKIMVNFRRASRPEACLKARQHLVRHICYRLWTLNSTVIRDVQIMGRVAGTREILWRQSVRITTPANAGQVLQRKRATPKTRRIEQERFRLLRSFLVNRLAIAGFLLCYWLLYLESTGHQAADQPSVAATPTQEQVQTAQRETEQPAEKTMISRSRPNPERVFTVPAQFQGQVIYEATPPANAEKVVALTFDDGPWKTTTEQILDILKQNNIKATFYMVGKAVQENPEIAKKVVEQGHAIGNHTWQHLMDNMDAATAAQELGNSARLIYEATGGVRTYLMRPPGGNLDGELVNYAKQQGYSVTMWSADSSDYYVSTPLIIDNVLSNIKPGGIALMHDGGGDRSGTVEALPQIISSLRSQGYKFVTIPELMELQARWATTAPAPGIDPTTPGAATTTPTLPNPEAPATTAPLNSVPSSPQMPTPGMGAVDSTMPGAAPAPAIAPDAAPQSDTFPSNPPPTYQEHGALPAEPTSEVETAERMPVAPVLTLNGVLPM